MDAGRRRLSDIIKTTRLLDVPFYQRGYVWGRSQWERLLDDAELISSTGQEYFIGSVILKQQEVGSGESYSDKRTIIDGQQRLTTLSIFFKALSLKLNNPAWFNDRFRLLDDDGDGIRELSIYHSRRDRKAFTTVLDATEAQAIDGDDKITDCFNYFIRHIDPNKIDINRVYGSLLFVGIDLGRDEDEQQIFDTINSLGVRLTTSELLKNFFFKEKDEEKYIEYWQKTFESEGNMKYWDQEIMAGRYKRSLIDTFFYAFLQIKIQDKNLGVEAKDKLLYGKVERLFDSYKHFLATYQDDIPAFLDEMRDYANLFRQSIHPDSINHPIEKDDAINRINNVIFGLDASILISYVLFVIKQNGNDTDATANVLKAIESYMARRVIVRASTKEYGSLFNESLILNNIHTRQGFIDYVGSKSDKNLYFPSDNDLKKGIHESKLTNSAAKGILYLIEASIRDYDRQSNSLLSLKRYSLEHLMPKKWENNWGKLDDPDAIDFRNSKLLTLGNLAIITQSLNANINDADWQTKLNGRGSHRGLKSYSGGIETLAEYLDKPVWNEEEIAQRANQLYDYAIGVWSAN